MPTDILILAAFFPELAPLRPLLGDAMRASVGGFMVEARVAGIGLPAAAAGAAVHVAEARPRAVLLLGSCGAYARGGLAVGDVVTARRLRLVDGLELGGLAQFPEPMPVATEADRAMSASLAATGARCVDLATTLAITVDDAAADRIAVATGAHIEHLEAHGVAAACAIRGVPFAALFGVANLVGSGARAEWRAHHRDAEEAAGDLARRWLEGGDPLGGR